MSHCYIHVLQKKKSRKERKSNNTRWYTLRKPRKLFKLVVRDQNNKWKVEGLECTRLIKLTTQFWLTKDLFGDNKTNKYKKLGTKFAIWKS